MHVYTIREEEERDYVVRELEEGADLFIHYLLLVVVVVVCIS